MIKMAHQVAILTPIESIKSKKGSFGSNNSNEPISVLDSRRSPSPSTSTSSFGGGRTTVAPLETGFPGYHTNLAGGRKDEWPALLPIPANDWERLLPESGASPEYDNLFRWISGDNDDDTSFTLKQLLQNNQIDENTPTAAAAVFETHPPPNFFPFPPPLPPEQIQLHHKPPVFNQGHEFLLKKQNQLLSLHQQRSMLAAAAKQEPPSPPAAPPPHHHQIICDHLQAAADLILAGNFPQAQAILARLNHQLPSAIPPLKPIERSGFYFKEALQTLISNSRSVPTPSDCTFKMCAYKALSEASPIVQFTNFTSNQALLEALHGADHIHIVDFDIGFGAQWASFIQELGCGNGGSSSLKITAFASPSTHHPIELGLIHENLSQFARETGISFELEIVNLDTFDPNSFSVSGHESVAVNFPIWSVSTHLPSIPSLLRFIKRLSPRVVVSLDRGCEMTNLPFPEYLLRGVQYYETLLDSIDAANVLPPAASKIEKFLLRPQIEGMVMGKLESPEPMPHWKTLFNAAGFSAVLFSNFAEIQADCVAKRAQVRGFHVEKRQAALVLCWRNRELVAASAWRC